MRSTSNLLALALQATLVLHHAHRTDARMRRLHLEDDDLAEMHGIGGSDGELWDADGPINQAPQRAEWPELLGIDARLARVRSILTNRARKYAAEAILRDRPELAVDVREDEGEATDAPSLESDSVVQIRVDANGLVAQIPRATTLTFKKTT